MTAGKFLLGLAQGLTLLLLSLLCAILGNLSASVSALKTDVAVLQAQKCECGQPRTTKPKNENLEDKTPRLSRK